MITFDRGFAAADGLAARCSPVPKRQKSNLRQILFLPHNSLIPAISHSRERKMSPVDLP